MANLGVNNDNKEAIAKAGGIAPLIELASSGTTAVKIEAIAALANLAVNGELCFQRPRQTTLLHAHNAWMGMQMSMKLKLERKEVWNPSC